MSSIKCWRLLNFTHLTFNLILHSTRACIVLLLCKNPVFFTFSKIILYTLKMINLYIHKEYAVLLIKNIHEKKYIYIQYVLYVLPSINSSKCGNGICIACLYLNNSVCVVFYIIIHITFLLNSLKVSVVNALSVEFRLCISFSPEKFDEW